MKINLKKTTHSLLQSNQEQHKNTCPKYTTMYRSIYKLQHLLPKIAQHNTTALDHSHRELHKPTYFSQAPSRYTTHKPPPNHHHHKTPAF